MKTVELKYLPGDTCWVEGQYRQCIIEDVIISKDGIVYNWYNLDVGVDCTEVWDDGAFTAEDIGETVFDTLEELEKAFPEDFDFPDQICEG
jgi:hypothetical protein